MNYKECLTYISSLAMLLLLAASCSGHDDLADSMGEEGVAGGKVGAYVTLSLSMGSRQEGTRANDDSGTTTDDTTTGDNTTTTGPKGGEDGDGSEVGQDYENEIDFVRIYFFKQGESDDEKGVNRDGATLVDATADFRSLVTKPDEIQTNPDKTLKVYSTETRRVELAPGIYDVVAVANVDPATLINPTTNKEISTLGELRDHVQKSAWTDYHNGRYGRFVMASADEATVTITAKNDINEPVKAVVDVERHAARVDYKAEEKYMFEYGSSGKNATVKIIGAGLVNNLTEGTYMLKRVAEKVGDDVKYLREETADETGVATNYVIDPWTTKKNSSDAIDDIYGVPFSYSDNADDWDELIKDGMVISTESDGTVWKCTGYTLENTVAADQTSQKHITGMVFKAQFFPPGYTEAKTFFTFDNVIYSDIESIMDAWWRTHNKTDVSGDLEKCSDITSLTDYVNDLPDDPVEYKDYLKGLLNNYTDIDELKKQYKLETFLENEFGYKKNADGTVEVDLDGKNTRLLIAKKDGGVQVYKNGICYYTWWIRHSNDGDDNKNGTMEYAIVRNNIYKLDVISISGLGTPIPDKENVRIRVYVRNWTLLPPEELEM